MRTFPRRPVVAVGGLVLVATALRLPLAAGQALWYDEWATWSLMQGSFAEMLRGVPRTEGSPPAFYVAEWLVTRVAGTGDLGLRVLPLACSLALVPAGYALGRRLAGERAGLALAGVAALHPWLAWLAAEARVYTLFALVAAGLCLAFAEALERRRAGAVAAWGVLAALMVATHYFGAFIVAAQAAWLFVARPELRAWLAAGCGAVAATALAVAPVWARQLENTEFFKEFDDAGRIEGLARAGLVGASPPTWHLAVPGAVVAVALAALVALALRRRELVASRGLAGALAVAAVATVAAAFDYLIARNAIGLWVGAAALAAVGVARSPRGAGAAVAAAAALLWCLATGALVVDERLHKADWDRAAALAGPPRPGLVVIAPGAFQAFPLGVYLGAGTVQQATASEVVAIGARPPTGREACGGPRCGLPAVDPADPGLPGLRLVDRRADGMWVAARFRADPPVAIDFPTAERFLPGAGEPAFFAHGSQPPPGG